jgi:hypothetical protein
VILSHLIYVNESLAFINTARGTCQVHLSLRDERSTCGPMSRVTSKTKPPLNSRNRDLPRVKEVVGLVANDGLCAIVNIHRNSEWSASGECQTCSSIRTNCRTFRKLRRTFIVCWIIRRRSSARLSRTSIGMSKSEVDMKELWNEEINWH